MEAVLSYNEKEMQFFEHSAKLVGWDNFVLLKFIAIFKESDLDVMQLMLEERVSILIYGWEICEAYLRNKTEEPLKILSSDIRLVIKVLTRFSLDTWFSREWILGDQKLNYTLLYCLERAKSILCILFNTIDWDYLLQLSTQPWQSNYLDQFFEVSIDDEEAHNDTIEMSEMKATEYDIIYLKQEGLQLALLRLIKMFDASAFIGVRKLSMRVLAAWNKIFENRVENNSIDCKVSMEERLCLVIICHVHLITVYEIDDVRGINIDNMVNDIRFYCQLMEKKSINSKFTQNCEFTPARFIARTCVNLGLTAKKFFENFTKDGYAKYTTTLFGVVSQAYLSYLLGNMLMEHNNMSEENFEMNVEYYKDILEDYVPEREISEIFIIEELRKQGKQRFSYNDCNTVKNMSNLRSKLCKGNRNCNIGNYENTDDFDDEEVDMKKELDCNENPDHNDTQRLDPVFQNIPNNKNILTYAYKILAKRDFKGWHFAKLALLIKIIGHELNMIETWRYHPGLTTEFMLSLELRLANHFDDLANIFQEHQLLEQEFWLTAFYLNPCQKFYHSIKRCGMRNSRRGQNGDQCEENVKQPQYMRTDRHATNPINSKFGLLSSTIDVKEIVGLTNCNDPEIDYKPLCKALRALKLPKSFIKDLLTFTFAPRNKALSWALPWNELRKRCKDLLKDVEQKRSLVELNMAEASDRLKYIKIDYEKYKHRPQLDYGTIEEGYENVLNAKSDDGDDESDESEEKVIEQPRKRGRRKKKKIELKPEVTESDEPQEFADDSDDIDFDQFYGPGKRITRTRKAFFKDTIRKMRKIDDTESKIINNEEGEDKSTTVTANESTVPSPIPQSLCEDQDEAFMATSADVCRDFQDLLNRRPIFNNITCGVKPFPDIWNVSLNDLEKAESSDFTLLETSHILDKLEKLENCSTIGTDAKGDLEQMDQTEEPQLFEDPMSRKKTPTLFDSSVNDEEEDCNILPLGKDSSMFSKEEQLSDDVIKYCQTLKKDLDIDNSLICQKESEFSQTSSIDSDKMNQNCNKIETDEKSMEINENIDIFLPSSKQSEPQKDFIKILENDLFSESIFSTPTKHATANPIYPINHIHRNLTETIHEASEQETQNEYVKIKPSFAQPSTLNIGVNEYDSDTSISTSALKDSDEIIDDYELDTSSTLNTISNNKFDELAIENSLEIFNPQQSKLYTIPANDKKTKDEFIEDLITGSTPIGVAVTIGEGTFSDVIHTEKSTDFAGNIFRENSDEKVNISTNMEAMLIKVNRKAFNNKFANNENCVEENDFRTSTEFAKNQNINTEISNFDIGKNEKGDDEISDDKKNEEDVKEENVNIVKLNEEKRNSINEEENIPIDSNTHEEYEVNFIDNNTKKYKAANEIFKEIVIKNYKDEGKEIRDDENYNAKTPSEKNSNTEEYLSVNKQSLIEQSKPSQNKSTSKSYDYKNLDYIDKNQSIFTVSQDHQSKLSQSNKDPTANDVPDSIIEDQEENNQLISYNAYEHTSTITDEIEIKQNLEAISNLQDQENKVSTMLLESASVGVPINLVCWSSIDNDNANNTETIVPTESSESIPKSNTPLEEDNYLLTSEESHQTIVIENEKINVKTSSLQRTSIEKMLSKIAQTTAQVKLRRLSVEDFVKYLRKPQIRLNRIKNETNLLLPAHRNSRTDACDGEADNRSIAERTRLLRRATLPVSEIVKEQAEVKNVLKKRPHPSTTDESEIDTDSSSDYLSKISTRCRTKCSRDNKNKLVVTPRSASGLKLRISSMKTTNSSSDGNIDRMKDSDVTSRKLRSQSCSDGVEVIQISSSSSDSQENEGCLLETVMETVTVDDTADPLFVEESNAVHYDIEILS